MGMSIIMGAATRALSLTLSPLPQAGEGNTLCRAMRGEFHWMGALEWE